MPEKTTATQPIPDRIDYGFKCGIKAYQEECDYPQFCKTVKLLSAKLPGVNESIRTIDLLNLLFESGALLELADIVLVVTECLASASLPPEDVTMRAGSPGKPDWTKLKGGEILKVASDFFVLNPEALMLFGIGRLGAVTQPPEAPKNPA